jgi:type IV secretory pathway component VirB8
LQQNIQDDPYLVQLDQHTKKQHRPVTAFDKKTHSQDDMMMKTPITSNYINHQFNAAHNTEQSQQQQSSSPSDTYQLKK